MLTFQGQHFFLSVKERSLPGFEMLFEQSGNIFTNNVKFEVYHRAFFEITKVCYIISKRYDGHRKYIGFGINYCKAYTIN
jgi:hypothetical protein